MSYCFILFLMMPGLDARLAKEGLMRPTDPNSYAHLNMQPILGAVLWGGGEGAKVCYTHSEQGGAT